jgi:outer membrane protein OmpA-like peptidoglycan-associated protein
VKNAATLTKMNVYTFDIQKSSESVYDQKNKSKPVQDIHINPGDLVTFQLIPNKVQDVEADVSKIQFQKAEAIVADGQSIMFSYVADGDSGIPDGNVSPMAGVGKVDTVSKAPLIAAKAQTTKSDQAAPNSSVSALAASPAIQKTTPSDTAKAHVADVNRKTPSDALPNTAPQKNTADEKKSANSVAENTAAPAMLTTAAVVSSQSATPKAKDANLTIATDNVVQTQQQKLSESSAVESGNKVSTPAEANEGMLTANTDEKNPTSSKNAEDKTSSNPPITTKENVVANTAETSPKDKVTSAEATTTRVMTNQNNVVQATPLVSDKPTSRSNATGIQYRVQIAASKSKLDDDQLKKIYQGTSDIRSFSEEGYHKYYIEQTPSYPTAKRKLNESGVTQAFIAAYQGDQKLNLLEAIALQKKSETSSSIGEPEIKNSTTEQLNVVNALPKSSTEVLAEKSNQVQPDGGKEMQVAVIQASKNAPASDLKTPEADLKNKLPVVSDVTNEPAKDASVHAAEVQQEKIAPITTEGKEKQVFAVDQSSQNTTSSMPAPDAKQYIAEENKNAASNIGTEKSASVVNTQPGNPKKIITEKIVTDTTKVSKDQIAVAIPSVPKTSSNVTQPEVKTQDLNKSSRVINERDDIMYRVQIAASEAPLSNASLKKIYHGEKEIHSFKEDGKYKYNIIETPNYFVAHQVLAETKVDQAFVSAYKNDVKIPLEDAINAQYKVPVTKENLAEIDSVVKVATVNFELDKFELQPDQLERLRNTVINELKSNPSYRAIVNGYTDIRGSEAYNFGLSQERALFVDQRIVAEGIDTGRVTTRYFGESQLAKYCPEHEACDESIHQANRRVEILLIVNKK